MKEGQDKIVNVNTTKQAIALGNAKWLSVSYSLFDLRWAERWRSKIERTIAEAGPREC